MRVPGDPNSSQRQPRDDLASEKFDAAAGAHLLYGDGGRNGTSSVRDGTTIPGPRRDPRGVPVQSGGEIHLGRAVLRVRG